MDETLVCDHLNESYIEQYFEVHDNVYFAPQGGADFLIL